jgi:hypothetical protein
MPPGRALSKPLRRRRRLFRLPRRTAAHPGIRGYSRVFAGILAKATERRPVTLANRSPVAADAQVGTLVRGARGG